MTDRCEPPEDLRGVDGEYWVWDHSRDEISMLLWAPNDEGGVWFDQGDPFTPEGAHAYGYRYLAPVASHAEVEALRARLRRLEDAAREVMDARERWGYGVALSVAIGELRYALEEEDAP